MCPKHPGQRYVPVLAGCARCVAERAATRGADKRVGPPGTAAPPLDREAWRRRAREIREQNFAVLAAIASMIPSAGDVAGHAVGMIGVAEIAARLTVARRQVRGALGYFRAWRVLWLQWRPAGMAAIRFERAVVAGLLAAQASAPWRVKRIMKDHRHKREQLAPYLGAKSRRPESSTLESATAGGTAA